MCPCPVRWCWRRAKCANVTGRMGISSAGIYVRISDDPTGRRAGVLRQLDDCRALCDRRGWHAARVYEDNDRGAWSGKPRPAYEELLVDMKAGVLDAVVVWHLDRLTRHPRELEEFFEIADVAGLRDMATVTGDIDLGTDDGRFHARILGAVARKESDDKSRRIRRKHEELAKAGKVGGGGMRPFGYESDRVTIRPQEAALVREAASRILAGASLRSIASDWAERAVLTPAGNHWRSTVLRRMLVSPRIAGLREHRGEVVAEAEWKGIVDEATHKRLLAIFDPRRANARPRRRYLLTGGVGRCGLCDAALVARPKAGGRRSYVCAAGVDFSGCGKIRQLADPLEDLVRDAVFIALDGTGLARALHSEREGDREAEMLAAMRADEESLEQLAQDHYVDRLISRREFLSAREALERRLESGQRAFGRLEGRFVLATVPVGRSALETAWTDADISWRRALIRAVLDSVVVNPAVQGRNFFDPSRVELVWRA